MSDQTQAHLDPVMINLFVLLGHILVVVEFCRYGNLRSYLLKQKTNFNPTFEDITTENSTGVKLGEVRVDVGE